jgi:hypothetical protein
MIEKYTQRITQFVQDHPVMSGVVSLSILFVLLLLLILPPHDSQTTKKVLQKKTSQNDTDKNSFSTSPPPSEIDWITGQTQDYTISFPSNWQPTTQAANGGGTFVIIQPSDTDSQFPQLTIQATPKSNGTPQAIVDSLATLKFQQKHITFKSRNAIQLSGTLPLKPTKDNPNQNLIHETYIIFENKNITYKITYAEYKDRGLQQNEDIMKSIIGTIQFN